MPGGELWQHIGDHYSEAYAARIMRSVLQTMAQLHAHGVVWRDSKPENFLFLNDREDSPLKAVDFGTAVRCAPGEHITIRAGKGQKGPTQLSLPSINSLSDISIPWRYLTYVKGISVVRSMSELSLLVVRDRKQGPKSAIIPFPAWPVSSAVFGASCNSSIET